MFALSASDSRPAPPAPPVVATRRKLNTKPFTESIALTGQSPAQLRPAQPHENLAPAEPSMFSRLFSGAGNLFTSIFGNTNPPQNTMAAASPHNPNVEKYDIPPNQPQQALDFENRRQSTTPPYKSTRFEFDPNENMMSLEPHLCDALNSEACSKKRSDKMNWKHELLDHINTVSCSGNPSAPYESLEPTSTTKPYAAPKPTAPEPTDLLSLQTQEFLKNSGLNEEDIGAAVIAAHQWE
ncbi:hypothetical protein Rin_00000400, partial [Candidatus Regiella insecticola 5.15]